MKTIETIDEVAELSATIIQKFLGRRDAKKEALLTRFLVSFFS